jgi:hypothetical protein
MTFPTVAEMVGPCGRGTFGANLRRLEAALPLSLPFFAALAILGLRRGPAWLLLLPVLTMVPSLFIIGFQHRYGIALAAAVALLFGTGLAGLVGGTGWRGWASLGCMLGLVGGLGAGLWNVPTAPLARATWGDAPPGAAPNVQILEPKGLTIVRQILRAEHQDGERIVDCAKGGLRMRMYPLVVDEVPTKPGLLPPACRSLLASPAAEATWVLAVVPGTVPAGWDVRYSLPRPEGSLILAISGRP